MAKHSWGFDRKANENGQGACPRTLCRINIVWLNDGGPKTSQCYKYGQVRGKSKIFWKEAAVDCSLEAGQRLTFLAMESPFPFWDATNSSTAPELYSFKATACLQLPKLSSTASRRTLTPRLFHVPCSFVSRRCNFLFFFFSFFFTPHTGSNPSP